LFPLAVAALNARLWELPAERDGRIAEQDAEISVLREALAGLQSQVADLAARVKSNSKNSSKPQSSDGLAKSAPKSLRGESGWKPGRPKGPAAGDDAAQASIRISGCGTGAVRLLREVPEERARDRDRAAGRGDRASAVRAAAHGHRDLPVARPVSVLSRSETRFRAVSWVSAAGSGSG
jgi:hypothetical protein